MADPIPFLIIGAGPTGLGAALRLKELGKSFLVIDGESQVGGLATSYKDEQGFTWDIGGHVQFSHYEYFDRVMDEALGEEGWFNHERESWIWMRDRFIPYPFQNNVRRLPKEDLVRCLKGLLELYRNPTRAKVRDFNEWIHATFGKGIAEVFLLPYNFKVWAFPPEDMDAAWVGERVAVADLSRIIDNVKFEKDDLSWGPNATFRFPKFGGTGAVWESVANSVGRDSIHLNKKVIKISGKEKWIETDQGERYSYEKLLSTMPLDLMIPLIEEADEKIKSRAGELVYSSSNIFGVGLKGEIPDHLKGKCWMYFPENDCPFYRVTVFSHYSMNNVPDPKTQWSLMAEVSESSKKPVDQEKVFDEVIQGMLNTKLISKDDEILSRWKFRAHHGYPTPFKGREQVLGDLHTYLKPLDIWSRGRFGGWKYEVSNQDHSMMQGVEWVNRVVFDVPETTYFFPAAANSGWGYPS